MQRTIKIGTRDSQLALWQANKVRKELEELGYQTEIVALKSTGDLVLDTPIYEMGITGVFTKTLDVALLKKEIDIAVHSLKDVPTKLPIGVKQAAVLRRANYSDILVLKDTEEFFGEKNATIATGSIRRKAQWLNRYPTHKVTGLRGNVNTRLQKLEENDWNGAIFAAAGLERLGLRPAGAINLSWMIPAPAQGAIMVASLIDDEFITDACEQINHRETEICTTIEREFLSILEGGCSAPIGALAYVDEKTDEINFKGLLLSVDGKRKISVNKAVKVGSHNYLAKDCADYVLNKGGRELMIDEGEEDVKEFAVFSTKNLSETQIDLFNSNIDVKSSDFLKIRFNRMSPTIVKNKIKNVVITSKNGVESILNSFSIDEINFKNIYCVGRRTKKLIEKRIGKVTFSASNSEKLSEYLIKELKEKEVTYFCSDIRLDTLPENLRENGITVHEIEAYKTISSPADVKDSIDGVLFFSPSTIESYLQKNTTKTIAFCIGETTATEARKHFKNVEVAHMPSVEDVIDLVNSYFSEN